MMTWQQYVEFTSTTALPIASNPEYLRLGVIEEAYEALEAYSRTATHSTTLSRHWCTASQSVT